MGPTRRRDRIPDRVQRLVCNEWGSMNRDARIRILLLAYYFPPMGLSGVQRTAKLVKYLPEFGVDVTVLTATSGAYFAFDDVLLKEVEQSGARIVRTRSFDPTRLFGGRRTVALPAEGHRSTLSRWGQFVFQPDNKIGWQPFALRAGRRILTETPHDAIYVTAPPYSALLSATRLAQQFKLPLVVDFRDDWVGNPRHEYPTSWHRRMALRQESRVLHAASRIQTINSVIAQNMAGRHPDLRKTIHVVPQGFDPQDFSADQTSASPERNDACTFLYTGVFYDRQRPDTFLKAFASACNREPDFRNRAVASFAGLVPAYMDTLVATLGIKENVRNAGYLDHERTIRAQQSADILWLTIGEGPGSEGISTGKLYEYLGAGRPILGLVPQGVARHTLEESGIGTICHPDDVESVSNAMLELFSDWQKGQLKGRADKTFLSSFDRYEQARSAAHIFCTLNAPSPG